MLTQHNDDVFPACGGDAGAAISSDHAGTRLLREYAGSSWLQLCLDNEACNPMILYSLSRLIHTRQHDSIRPCKPCLRTGELRHVSSRNNLPSEFCNSNHARNSLKRHSYERPSETGPSLRDQPNDLRRFSVRARQFVIIAAI